MSSEKPLVYLVLGSAGSGRREIIADLVADGLTEGDRAAVLLADAEPPSPHDARLPGVERWRWEPDTGSVLATRPEGATHVFLVADGRRNPLDQIEAFKLWVAAQGGELARVLCVVDCQLAEKTPALLAWFEACVHFSDVVLLNRREGVANKWLSEFQAHFKGQFIPCLFEFVREGRVKNPALVLLPEARRMSHFLDAEHDWVFTNADGEQIEEDEEAEGDEEVTVTPEEDPWLEKLTGGRRVRTLPDIAAHLPPPAAPA